MINKAIAFYNDFLEKQASYSKETATQRQFEKDWIDSQRQQLEKVTRETKMGLNSLERRHG
ncbi:MAG: hypothetical protein ACOC04_04625 [Halothece sp.]